MIRRLLIVLPLPIILCLSTVLATSPTQESMAGYVLERDAEVAKNEPGPHDGSGPQPAMPFSRKRRT